MNELDYLLGQHFEDTITVKIVTEDYKLIYKGLVKSWASGVSGWCKREHCDVYGVARWRMYEDMLCVQVDLLD